MKMLKIPEVAALTGCSARTIHRWLAAGLLKGRKLGGCTRIAEDDLKAFLEALPARPTVGQEVAR
jgi:excisionase family DNA binding protein